MKRILKSLGLVAGIAAMTAFGTVAQAGLVTVSFDGSYDERTEAPSGDYDAIGGFVDVGAFDLIGAAGGFDNTFSGSLSSPNDSSDAFVIRLGADQTLTGASISFGENITPFNPMFAFPAPSWTLEESSTTPTIFAQTLGYDWMSSPATYTPAFAPIGEGIYSLLIGNGTFGTYSEGHIDYTITFTVDSPQISVVPLPAALPLYGAGMALLGFIGWKRKRKQA